MVSAKGRTSACQIPLCHVQATGGKRTVPTPHMKVKKERFEFCMRCALLVLAALFSVRLIKIPLAVDLSRYSRSLEDKR